MNIYLIIDLKTKDIVKVFSNIELCCDYANRLNETEISKKYEGHPERYYWTLREVEGE